MALALNNLKRVDMPLNKETKPNQTYFILNVQVTGGSGSVPVRECDFDDYGIIQHYEN